MPTIDLDEFSRLATVVFDKKVLPNLRPEDDGKFVALDVRTGDYEIDADDYTAVMRLRARLPSADVFLARAGYETTCRIGRNEQ